MQKIIIPTYIEYNACQLTIDNLDNFKNFISKNAYDIRITYKEMKNKSIPIKINFKWHYGDDCSSTICVLLNQYFLYKEDKLDKYKVLNSEDIRKEWYIYEN